MLETFVSLFSFEALPETPRTLISIALLIILALVVIGFVVGPYSDPRKGRTRKGFELPQTFLLIGVAALIWLTAAQNGSLAGMALCFTVGMAFGWLGDLFMANLFGQKNHVIFGMAAFGVGHIFYMLAFAQIAGYFGYGVASHYALALIVTEAAAVILWALLVRKAGSGPLQYIALGYGAFLAAMGGFALALALHEMAFIPLAVGAVLFLLSDTLIAADLFAGRRFPFMGDLIWLTYIAAQALIVCSAALPLAQIGKLS